MAVLWHDFLSLSVWWLYFFALGLAFLPLAARAFPRFFDVGYPFAKVIGLGITAYGTWLAVSLRLFPFTRGPVLVFAVGCAALVLSTVTHRDALKRVLRAHWRIVLAEEAVFFMLLGAWSYLRGIRPEILGLEKFMDYGIAAAITRGAYLPPEDMWLAGESVNYYYFGHFVLALSSRLTGVALPVAYNLMTATLPALGFCLTFSLTANLMHAVRRAAPLHVALAGLLSATLLTFGGNLHAFVFAYGVPAMERVGIAERDARPAVLNGYRYYDATRYVGYDPPTHERTIHEFPFYSFVVADLHAHVSDIPFVLTFVALLTAFLLEPARAGPRFWSFPVWSGLALAILEMTNAWDFPIYAFITLAALSARGLVDAPSVRQGFLRVAVTYGATLFVVWLASLPFTSHYQAHYTTLGWVEGRTPFHQLLVLWGVPFGVVALYLAAGAGEAIRRWRRGARADWVELTRADAVACLLIVSALGLVLVPEVVYVRDIYVDFFYRANTMFKLTYQACLLFGVVLGFCAVRVWGRSRWIQGVLLLLLPLPLAYTTLAVRGFYGRVHPFHYKGLDGLVFLDTYRPGDGAAVRWLNTNVTGPRVILEANGYSYTDHGRISMATGLPTVVGWYVHEWLWRGEHSEVDRRVRDVATFYNAGPGDVEAARAVLAKYTVDYVVIGDLERSRFPALQEPVLEALGEIVFDTKGTKIISVDREK